MVTVGSEGFRGRVLADHVRDFLFAHDAELKTQTVTVGRVRRTDSECRASAIDSTWL